MPGRPRLSISPNGDQMAYVYAGRYGPEYFLDAAGDLLPRASIIVYLRGTTTLASLYTDRTKGTAAANPFVVDSLGNGTFHADPGEYDLVYGAVTVPVTVPVDPQDAIDQGGGGAVASVNGHTGVVVLSATDVGAYGPGGTDVAVADGGTGASTAAAARTNLGLGTAATQATGAFEAAGAVATEATARATADALLAPIASPTFTGVATTPALSVSGLTGSVAASRYVGAVASAAPTTGAHLVGDWVVSQAGGFYICTVAGTPGTWAASTTSGAGQVDGGAPDSVYGGTTAIDGGTP